MASMEELSVFFTEAGVCSNKNMNQYRLQVLIRHTGSIYIVDKLSNDKGYVCKWMIPDLFGDKAFVSGVCSSKSKARSDSIARMFDDPIAGSIVMEAIKIKDPEVDMMKLPKKSYATRKTPRKLSPENMLGRRWIAYPYDGESFGPYIGLSMDQITCVVDEKTLVEACASLSVCEVIGFDMEWKPIFQRGIKNTGPHLIQLSTTQHAFLFSVPDSPNNFDTMVQTNVISLLHSESILKVGFGLTNDFNLLKSKLDCTPTNTIDLCRIMKGSRSIKSSVKSLYNLDFAKLKRLTLSNWSKPLSSFSAAQVQYAADDAHAALKVYLDWQVIMANFEEEDRFTFKQESKTSQG